MQLFIKILKIVKKALELRGFNLNERRHCLMVNIITGQRTFLRAHFYKF